MKISDKAFLEQANHGFASGVRAAVVEFLEELESRGVSFGYDYNMNDLANEVRHSTGINLLDEE